jgi:hypothetical protein
VQPRVPADDIHRVSCGRQTLHRNCWTRTAPSTRAECEMSLDGEPEVARSGSGTETPQPRVEVAQPGRSPSADGPELTAGTASTESESEEPQNGEEAMVASAQRLSLVSTQNSHEAQQWLQHEWQSTTERWENLPRDTDRQTFAEKVEELTGEPGLNRDTFCT